MDAATCPPCLSTRPPLRCLPALPGLQLERLSARELAEELLQREYAALISYEAARHPVREEKKKGKGGSSAADVPPIEAVRRTGAAGRAGRLGVVSRAGCQAACARQTGGGAQPAPSVLHLRTACSLISPSPSLYALPAHYILPLLPSPTV